jgi:hypothetical protein
MPVKAAPGTEKFIYETVSEILYCMFCLLNFVLFLFVFFSSSFFAKLVYEISFIFFVFKNMQF